MRDVWTWPGGGGRYVSVTLSGRDCLRPGRRCVLVDDQGRELAAVEVKFPEPL